MKRVIFDILLIISVFLLPWWASISLAIIGLFIFKSFYEFLVSSVIVNVISTTKDISFTTRAIIPYVLIIVFYIFVQYLRNNIILYKDEKIPYKS